MDIFNVITLAGGLAMFLYGMSTMGSGLEKLSGGRLERILEKLTNNVFKSVLFGLLVTACIQSSSATTVIVVGFVNAGIMRLRQAIGVIMGANIGTTVTAQILRLSDISGDNLFLRLLKPTALAPIVAIIGIVLFMFCKKASKKDLGQILLGFGILFQGMFAMEAAMEPLQHSEAFGNFLITLSNPLFGVVAGAVVTAVIQSSSASIGILQALSSTGKVTYSIAFPIIMGHTGKVTYSIAFPIIMGQNIGTCITSLLASIGTSKNARRTAMVHLYFNVIGTVLFLIGTYAIQYTIGFSFWEMPIDRGGIANFHTFFNVVVTLVFIPFTRLLEKLACMTIRDKNETDSQPVNEILDERFLVSPSLALQKCTSTVERMAALAKENFSEIIALFEKYDTKTADRIRENEDAIDKMEDKLGQYLLKLTQKELNESENKTVTELLHLINEFERIGDYAINVLESAEHMYNHKIAFSDQAKKELSVINEAVSEIIDKACTCFENRDNVVAAGVEPLEETIDMIQETLKNRHVERLKEGTCSIEAGVVLLDILTNLERISDHCSNIALYILDYNSNVSIFDHHEYLKNMHEGSKEEFNRMLSVYEEKYYARI